MADNSRILKEITNVVRTSYEVLPDDTPLEFHTWFNRAVNLLLWAAEILGDRPAYEIAAEIREQMEE